MLFKALYSHIFISPVRRERVIFRHECYLLAWDYDWRETRIPPLRDKGHMVSTALVQERESVTITSEFSTCRAIFSCEIIGWLLFLDRQGYLRATGLFLLFGKGGAKFFFVCVCVCTKNCKTRRSRVLIYLSLDQAGVGALVSLVDVGDGQRLFILLHPAQTRTQSIPLLYIPILWQSGAPLQTHFRSLLRKWHH